jgi:hypothetical protein
MVSQLSSLQVMYTLYYCHILGHFSLVTCYTLFLTCFQNFWYFYCVMTRLLSYREVNIFWLGCTEQPTVRHSVSVGLKHCRQHKIERTTDMTHGIVIYALQFYDYVTIVLFTAWLWIMPSSGKLHCVNLVRNDVSEERSASILRVARIGELWTTLAISSNQRTL